MNFKKDKKSIIKENIIKYFHLQRFVFNSTFKTLRTYIYNILIPFIIMFTIYLINTSFGNVKQNYFSRIWVLSLLLIGPVTSLISVSTIILNWRQSVIIKQIKVFNVSKKSIILTLLVNTVMLVLISYYSLVALGCLADLLLCNKNFIGAIGMLNKFHTLILIFFNLIICAITVFLISYTISFLVGSTILVQTINVVLIIFTIVFCNFIDPNRIKSYNANLILDVIGYLNPFKAIQWMLISTYVDAFDNPKNLIRAIWSNFAILPYTFGFSNHSVVYYFAFLVEFFFISGLSIPIIYIKYNKI